jgi:hypothetical protein
MAGSKKPFLSISAAANEIGCSRKTVTDAVQKGQIPVLRLNKRLVSPSGMVETPRLPAKHGGCHVVACGMTAFRGAHEERLKSSSGVGAEISQSSTDRRGRSSWA